MTILRVTNKTVEEKTIIPERDCLMVQKPFLDPVSLPINGTDKLTAQDETRAAITQQAVRKKESSLHIRFKDYVLSNLQALH